MSLWLDIKYASMLSNSLERYTVKQNNPYLSSFRCPICGDSKKNKSKTRGFLYVKHQKLVFKCHNCSEGLVFKNFLKTVNPQLHQQYVLETYKDGNSDEEKEMVFEQPKFDIPEDERLIDKLMDRVSRLDDDHVAVKYCRSRMIPEDKFRLLYYVDDVSKIGQLLPRYADRIDTHEARLAIPCFSRQGKLIGLTCRSFDPNHPLRYMIAKVNDELPLTFGHDRLDMTKTSYWFEGPLDSLFFENAAAVGNANLTLAGEYVSKDKAVLVFDNQPRNKQVCREYIKAANQGFRVVVWPTHITEKDVNEMILSGYSQEELLETINTNTFKDARLRLAIQQWRKC